MNNYEDTGVKERLENVLKSHLSLKQSLKQESPIQTPEIGRQSTNIGNKLPTPLLSIFINSETQRKHQLDELITRVKEKQHIIKIKRTSQLESIKGMFRYSESSKVRPGREKFHLTAHINDSSHISDIFKSNTFQINSCDILTDQKLTNDTTANSLNPRNSMTNSLQKDSPDIENRTHIDDQLIDKESQKSNIKEKGPYSKSLTQQQKTTLNAISSTRRASGLPKVSNISELVHSKRRNVQFSRNDEVIEYSSLGTSKMKVKRKGKCWFFCGIL